MRIHFLQHLPFDDGGAVHDWAIERGHDVTRTHFPHDPALPDTASIDLLVVFGGFMNIYDHDVHPWLDAETRWLAAAARSGVRIVGLCLGAQLLAEALGGSVYRNDQPEVGWHEVTRTKAGAAHPVYSVFPERFPAFNWHTDACVAPPGAEVLASSAATPVQAFSWGTNVLALQFHLEATPGGLEELVTRCGDAFPPGPFIQPRETMRDAVRFKENGALLAAFFDRVCEKW